jgi:hypothetical protein
MATWTPTYEAPAVPPPIGSRWQVIGFDWENDCDCIAYTFTVDSVVDGFAHIRHDDGVLDRMWCGGTYEWTTSPVLVRIYE